MHFSHGMGNYQAEHQSQPKGISRMEWVIVKQDFRASPRVFLAWNEGFLA